MIRVNLAPIEELDNRLWFLPDLIFIAAIGVGAWLGVQAYLAHTQEEISQMHEEAQEHQRNITRLEPELKRYELLTKQVDLLDEKIKSVQRITVSKIERYKSIIVLEHLQNIKPEGVWYQQLTDNSGQSHVKLTGQAFDNLLIAEFMSALDSTRLQEVDNADMRSLIYFKNVRLEKVATTSDSVPKPEPAAANPSAPLQTQDPTKATGQASIDELAGMNKFPVFELTLEYASRGIDSALDHKTL